MSTEIKNYKYGGLEIMNDYDPKVEYARRAMGEKCVNCGHYIVLPERVSVPDVPDEKCDCGHPQTQAERLLSMFTEVRQYRD